MGCDGCTLLLKFRTDTGMREFVFNNSCRRLENNSSPGKKIIIFLKNLLFLS